MWSCHLNPIITHKNTERQERGAETERDGGDTLSTEATTQPFDFEISSVPDFLVSSDASPPPC